MPLPPPSGPSVWTPDSRTRHRTRELPGPDGIYSRVYCWHCGKDGGLALNVLSLRYISYLCNQCVADGYAPQAVEIPESVARGLVQCPSCAEWFMPDMSAAHDCHVRGGNR